MHLFENMNSELLFQVKLWSPDFSRLEVFKKKIRKYKTKSSQLHPSFSKSLWDVCRNFWAASLKRLDYLMYIKAP